MKVQVACVIIVKPSISLSYPILLLCSCDAREEGMDDSGFMKEGIDGDNFTLARDEVTRVYFH